MATKSVSDETFHKEVETGTVVVDFWAQWCGPCRAIAPVLERLSDQYPDIKVLKVDIMENKDLAVQYGVRSIPYLAIFKDGVMVDSKVGFSGAQSLETLFEELAE